MNRLIYLGLVIVAYLALRFYLRRVFAGVGQKALARQPDRIHLHRLETPTWRNPAAAETHAAALTARGFTDVGTFAVPEMPPLTLRLWAKPEEQVCATIYEHEKVGVWMDLFSRFTDGTGITYANTRDRGLAQRPGRPVVHLAGAAPEELCRRFMQDRPHRSMVTITPEELPAFYENSYAEQMVWRKQKGISVEEVAHVAKTRT